MYFQSICIMLVTCWRDYLCDITDIVIIQNAYVGICKLICYQQWSSNYEEIKWLTWNRESAASLSHCPQCKKRLFNYLCHTYHVRCTKIALVLWAGIRRWSRWTWISVSIHIEVLRSCCCFHFEGPNTSLNDCISIQEDALVPAIIAFMFNFWSNSQWQFE